VARPRTRVPATHRGPVDPGVYGFACATFMVIANMVGWYGSAAWPLLIFPFATAAGGIAQGVAALWAFKARYGLATAIHGIWAAFWLGYGFLNFMIALKFIPAPLPHAAIPELGYWFFVLAAVTLAGTIASLASSALLGPPEPDKLKSKVLS